MSHRKNKVKHQLKLEWFRSLYVVECIPYDDMVRRKVTSLHAMCILAIPLIRHPRSHMNTQEILTQFCLSLCIKKKKLDWTVSIWDLQKPLKSLQNKTWWGHFFFHYLNLIQIFHHSPPKSVDTSNILIWAYFRNKRAFKNVLIRHINVLRFIGWWELYMAWFN